MTDTTRKHNPETPSQLIETEQAMVAWYTAHYKKLESIAFDYYLKGMRSGDRTQYADAAKVGAMRHCYQQIARAIQQTSRMFSFERNPDIEVGTIIYSDIILDVYTYRVASIAPLQGLHERYSIVTLHSSQGTRYATLAGLQAMLDSGEVAMKRYGVKVSKSNVSSTEAVAVAGQLAQWWDEVAWGKVKN